MDNLNRALLMIMAMAIGGHMHGQKKETATASATVGAAPRIAIVLSSFRGSADHDGNPIVGLADPSPVDADLSPAQVDAMLRKALELGVPRRSSLDKIVGSEDWVVILTEPSTDSQLIQSLVAWLTTHKAGARITIASGGDRNRGAAEYNKHAAAWISVLSGQYPKVRFDLTDLSSEECIEMTVPGKPAAAGNPSGAYCIAKTIQQCDRLISIASLKTHPRIGVALSMYNHLLTMPESNLDKLRQPGEVVVDLFSLRPADYAVVGGRCGVEDSGCSTAGASRVRHNAIIAGADAVAVDSVAASIMGFDPAELPFLRVAADRGLGTWKTELIWTRGNEIDEARRPFRKPPEWSGEK